MLYPMEPTSCHATVMPSYGGCGQGGRATDAATDSAARPRGLRPGPLRCSFRGAVVALDVARRYGSRLTGLVVSGAPLQEPVAWHGPIVMNTKAEIQQAIAELRNGTFIKPAH